jgi:hypothetical protein
MLQRKDARRKRLSASVRRNCVKRRNDAGQRRQGLRKNAERLKRLNANVRRRKNVSVVLLQIVLKI